jgi:hypothetical protein
MHKALQRYKSGTNKTFVLKGVLEKFKKLETHGH